MRPHLKEAIEDVVRQYYRAEKANYEWYAVNKRPKAHVFHSLEILKNEVSTKRKDPPPVHCWGKEELKQINEAMQEVNRTLDMKHDQHVITKNLYHHICLVLESGKNLTQEELNELKKKIIARIRNMTLTQNTQ